MSDLATRLEKVILGTPGVVAVYRSGSPLTHLVGAGADALSAPPLDRVRVVHNAARTHIEATIGVGGSIGAIVTAEQVRARVEALLRADGVSEHSLTITVAHISVTDALP